MAAKKKTEKKVELVREGTQWWIVVNGKQTVDAGRNERYAAALMRDLYPE